jgi:beta-phosphoglucomutase-like phosphatase (HAD superfamily)
MAEMMNTEQAFNTLVSKVHAPTFFEKLARDYGVRPQNEDEARELLLMAAQLRNAYEQETTKQAAERTNTLAQARNSLNSQLTSMGYGTLEQTSNQTNAAAAVATTDESIKQAALVMAANLGRLVSE